MKQPQIRALALLLGAMLALALCLPSLAMAQVSPYCPAQNLTVASGGSVT